MKYFSMLVISACVFFHTPTTQGADTQIKKTLTISCGSTGIELSMCKSGVEAWSKKTGHEVRIFSSPNDSNDRLALYQQLLGAKSSDIDIYQIDVVWPGLLEKHFLNLEPFFTANDLKGEIEYALRNNRVGNKLVAIPWWMDGGVLYYRADLLKKYNLSAPQTWQQLGEIAKTILDKEHKAGNKDLFGYVFQGRAYEGLTCNALEWIASYGGGTIVDATGKVTINNNEAKSALTLIASWMDTLVPKGVLNYSEEEARGVFQSGKSVFMRNWPYAWALLNSEGSPVKDKVAMAALPSGSKNAASASTLGGWSLSVSAYSKHPKESAELVKYLTSLAEQKRRAIAASFNPTFLALYSDPDVLKNNPHLKELKSVFLNTVPRPASQTKTQYNKVSATFWQSVHEVLSSQKKAEDSLAQLETKLLTYSKNGQW